MSQFDEMKIMVMPDAKQEIKFWLDALQVPGISQENINHLNTCLANELRVYMHPHIVLPNMEKLKEMGK